MVVTTDAKSTLCGSLTTATQKEKMSHIISPPSTYCQNAMYKEYLCFPTLMLRKTEGKRRRGQQRMRWLDNITDSMDMNLRKSWEILEDRGAWHATGHGITKSWTQLSD